MNRRVQIRKGTYHDSVSLMVVSRIVGELDGVDVALVAMATELNAGLLLDLGFEQDALAGAGPNDLVIAVQASDDDAVARAREATDAALARASSRSEGAGGLGAPRRARTVGAAVGRRAADLALVSVPGRHAFVEAAEALRAGLHVMVFSDNVPLDQEIALKAEAARRGLLVMGPDCGTAILGGVGLGFANVVRPGPVGLVAASGTGAQQLCCLLDDADVGVSHVLGVGGRDLSEQVGGASTLQALEALDADPATAVIVVVSKPPAKTVADRVREAARACDTPTVLAFLGRGGTDLTSAAGEALRAAGRDPVEHRSWPAAAPLVRRRGYLRGLFAGGTLCDEAMAIAAEALGPVASNIPLDPQWALPETAGAGVGLGHRGHLMIDFGDDRLTHGRPHPMIDNQLRMERIAKEAADPDTAVLLLDVVLGHAAHPDPAAELAPAVREAIDIAAAGGRQLTVVVSLCGSREDPQDRDAQAQALCDAGASVHLSNAAAARQAVALLDKEPA